MCCCSLPSTLIRFLLFFAFESVHSHSSPRSSLSTGKTPPVNFPGNRGGWDAGNDVARTVVTVFGTFVLMVADVVVNDPSNLPARFSKSYRESLTAVRD